MSVYHDYEKWRIFNNKGYSRELDRDSTRRFKSAYSNLGEWIDHMDYIIQRPFVPGKGSKNCLILFISLLFLTFSSLFAQFVMEASL